MYAWCQETIQYGLALTKTIILLQYSAKAVPFEYCHLSQTVVTLMSYLKLLRTVIDICVYTTLTVYPSEPKIVVWYINGNLLYGRYPHIFLLLVAIATLMLVYLPYTLILFSIQWLRKFSHLRVLRWISKFNPVFLTLI